MADIDEYLQNRKLQEAEEALEEAKRRLAQEKSQLKEEQKRAKKESHHREDSDDYDEPRGRSHDSDDEGGYSLKPWMLWNLIILGLVLLLFGVSMFYPKAPAVDYAKIESTIDQKLDDQEKEITALKAELNDQSKEDKEKAAAEKALDELTDSTTGPKFTLNVQDEDGNTIGNKGSVEVINGTESTYVLIVQNKENDVVRCDADRIVNNKTKKEVFKNLKIAALEVEDLPQEVTNESSTMKLEYDFSCHFEDEIETTEQSIEFTYTFK